MLWFTLIMLMLALMAQFRGPAWSYLSVPWFFSSWLPGELPWLFAGLQLIGVIAFLLSGDSFGLTETVAIFITAITLLIWYHLHKKTWCCGAALYEALTNGLGKDIELPNSKEISSSPAIKKYDWLKPFSYKREGVERLTNIAYGSERRNWLDICRSTHSDNSAARPVLLHIHGGAWVLGSKHQQAIPLMNYLALNGWICVDINYRLGPKDLFPACLIDIKKAIVWIKENIADYGGDPEFIAITGESAGGHLCALAALTANDPQWQLGFEEKNTDVQAAVPIYGVYDFTNQERDGLIMQRFLERFLMPNTFAADEDMWKNASPIFHIENINLPMLIIHGDKDCVVPVIQARDFAERLKPHNQAPTIYAEIPGAQHGFDLFHSVRTEFHIQGVGDFLKYCYVKKANFKAH